MKFSKKISRELVIEAVEIDHDHSLVYTKWADEKKFLSFVMRTDAVEGMVKRAKSPILSNAKINVPSRHKSGGSIATAVLCISENPQDLYRVDDARFEPKIFGEPPQGRLVYLDFGSHNVYDKDGNLLNNTVHLTFLSKYGWNLQGIKAVAETTDWINRVPNRYRKDAFTDIQYVPGNGDSLTMTITCDPAEYPKLREHSFPQTSIAEYMSGKLGDISHIYQKPAPDGEYDDDYE